MQRAWLSFVLLAACGSSDGPSKAPAPQAEPPAEAEAPAARVAEAAPPIARDAKATVGQAAPDFTLRDLEGTPHELSQYRGKTVVLEWFNPLCPFVKYAHTEGPLQSMAKTKVEGGIVWLAINSGAPGKQGHGAEVNREGASGYGMTHPILLDETGEVGRAYGAEKTPHMYVIDPEGKLLYRGAIDNAPFGEVDGGGAYVDYVEAALEALAAGKTIEPAETPSYGCTVKYAAG